jgi:hypothetical protein
MTAVPSQIKIPGRVVKSSEKAPEDLPKTLRRIQISLIRSDAVKNVK